MMNTNTVTIPKKEYKKRLGRRDLLLCIPDYLRAGSKTLIFLLLTKNASVIIKDFKATGKYNKNFRELGERAGVLHISNHDYSSARLVIVEYLRKRKFLKNV